MANKKSNIDSNRNGEILEKILRMLGILVFFEADKYSKIEKSKLSDIIRLLAELNLRPYEIANIIGKPTKYVTATISKAKKTKNQAKGK